MPHTADAALPPSALAKKPVSPLILVLVAGALLMENIDSTVLNTVTQTIAADFQVDALQLKFALTAYLVSLSVGIPISGKLADHFGARPIFTLALVLFCSGSLGCGIATNLPALVFTRLLQGAGGALMVPVARLVLLRSYPKGELVRITNLTALPALLGPAIGPLLGGAVATYVHWRAVFLINVPLCLFGMWITHRALPRSHQAEPLDVDPIAFATFASALCGVSLALECVGDPMLSATHQALVWALALASLAAYVGYTALTGHSLLQLRLFKLRTFRLGVLGNLVSRLGVGSVPFLMPLMLQMRFGYTPLQAALHLTPMPVGMVLVRGAVSPLLRRLGFRRLLVFNTLLLGVSLASFSSIDAHTKWPVSLGLLLLYGTFASIHFACMNVLAYVDIAEGDMSAATSIVSTVHTFAMGTGVALGALLVSVFLRLGGTQPGGPAYAFHRTFAALGLATALSAVWFARLGDGDGDAVSGHATKAGPKA